MMDGDRIVASVKAPTTEDGGSGIIAVVRDVLAEAGVVAGALHSVMIGTTQFTNAFVQRRRLIEVGIIRLALPATTSLPPLVDWPEDLVAEVGRNVCMAHGGYEFDGRRISALREPEILAAVHDFKARGLRSIAISSVFAPMNDDMEKRVEEIARNEIADVHRRTEHGFAIGEARIAGLGKWTGEIRIRVQNENLLAAVEGRVVTMVPDLICVLDRETGEAVTTERLRYGQRVAVMGVSVPLIMRTPEALAVFGPKAFGIDLPFTQVDCHSYNPFSTCIGPGGETKTDVVLVQSGPVMLAWMAFECSGR